MKLSYDQPVGFTQSNIVLLFSACVHTSVLLLTYEGHTTVYMTYDTPAK